MIDFIVSIVLVFESFGYSFYFGEKIWLWSQSQKFKLITAFNLVFDGYIFFYFYMRFQVSYTHIFIYLHEIKCAYNIESN